MSTPDDTPPEPEANGAAAAAEWRRTRIDKAEVFTDSQVEALELAGIRTLGGLQEAMVNEPEWWCRNLKINGRFKNPVEQALTDFVSRHAQQQTRQDDGTDTNRRRSGIDRPAE
jgi:hypothetical protein